MCVLRRVNPSGKLPVTWIQSLSDLPAYPDMSMTTTPGRTYRYFTGTPLLKFGHGMSYTTFRFTSPHVPALNGPCGGIPVTVQLNNTGLVDGTEVVQVYLQTPFNQPPNPTIRLAGFQRVSLAPASTAEVVFTVGTCCLAINGPCCDTLAHWHYCDVVYSHPCCAA